MSVDRRHRPVLSVARMADKEMTSAERFWWVVYNVILLGIPYVFKFMLKKAILEALIAYDNTR